MAVSTSVCTHQYFCKPLESASMIKPHDSNWDHPEMCVSHQFAPRIGESSFFYFEINKTEFYREACWVCWKCMQSTDMCLNNSLTESTGSVNKDTYLIKPSSPLGPLSFTDKLLHKDGSAELGQPTLQFRLFFIGHKHFVSDTDNEIIGRRSGLVAEIEPRNSYIQILPMSYTPLKRTWLK